MSKILSQTMAKFKAKITTIVEEHERLKANVQEKIESTHEIQKKLNRVMGDIQYLRQSRLDQMEITSRTVEEMRLLDHDTENIISHIKCMWRRLGGKVTLTREDNVKYDFVVCSGRTVIYN